MKTKTDFDTSVSPASVEMTFKFLQMQISYVTSHLQIADGKAAGIIAYVSILSGYTASKVRLNAEPSFGIAVWFALIGGAIGFIALLAAFLVVIPRGWPGRNSTDPFSWVGLSAAACATPYVDRLPQLTLREMQRALADSVETTSLIISLKYRLVSVAVVTSIVATALQTVSWLLN